MERPHTHTMMTALLPVALFLANASPLAPAAPATDAGVSDIGSRAQVVRVGAPFARAVNQSAIPPHLRESVAALDADASAWAALAVTDHAQVERLPLGPNIDVTAVVHRIDPFELNPTLVAAEFDAKGRLIERSIPRPQLECFLGAVEGRPDSRVMLACGEGIVAGYVIDDGRTWVISNGRTPAGGPIVSYAMDEVPPGTFPEVPWSCEALLPPNAGNPTNAQGGIASLQPCRQSRIAVETDTEFLGKFGGSEASATAYIGTMFAALVDIYGRDVFHRPGLSYLRLWTGATDPWNTTSSSAALSEFRDYWYWGMFSIVRDSTHMISGRGLGGGVAYLNAGCGDYAYGVSGNIAGSFPYPLQNNNGANWDIMVVAHELGHNFGAPHTHNYTPPADGCGSSPQDCTAADQDIGTIMSYCHTCSGGLTNIQLRFHAMSIASIDGYLQSGVCPFFPPQQPPLAFPDRLSAIPGSTIDIDVLANDVRYNCENISVTAVTPPATGGTVTILPGAGPNGRELVRFTSLPTQPTPAQFTYTISEPDDDSHSTTVTVDLNPLRAPENPLGDTPGIATDYYALSNPSVLPNFSALTPYASTVLADVNIPSTSGNFATSGRADQVGARFVGWLDVPTSGAWTLFTNSDDGSRLLVGTTPVVLNDGLHPMQERSGTIDLAAGRHAITMEFFENGGGAGMIASWQGPGVTKVAIPASALSHGGAPLRADTNHDGAVDGLDLTMILSSWGSSDPVADVNQDGTVSGPDLTQVLAAWTN